MNVPIEWKRAGSVGLALATVVLAASCGGSDDGTPPPAAVTPSLATAGNSVSDFIAYLKVLTATTQDTVEPLDVTTFVAPTSDTTEPDPSV